MFRNALNYSLQLTELLNQIYSLRYFIVMFCVINL